MCICIAAIMTMHCVHNGCKNHHHHHPHLVQKLFFLFALVIISTTSCITATRIGVNGQSDGNEAVKCKDDSGNDVDWFIAYKFPKIHDSVNPYIRQGLGYAFVLPGQNDWQVSVGKGIDNPDSLVGWTLRPLFHEDVNTTTNLAYIGYNDQPPTGPTVDSGGHTKGVIIAKLQGGLWLQHSVPHFPNLQDKYSYPKTGETNGQVFHCLTLELDQVDNVGNILTVTKPHVFNFSIPEELGKALPNLEKVVRQGHEKLGEIKMSLDVADYYQFVDLYNNSATNGINDAYYKYETKSDLNYQVVQIKNAGRVLDCYAKGPSFHEEIYSGWIAGSLKSELDVQSWLNGPNPYPSNCTSSSTKVYNIEDKDVAGVRFSTHNDHAKWAVATQRPVVCIGDLNRMEHQTKRGGTVNCFTEKAVWKIFKGMVVTIQPCPKPYKLSKLSKIRIVS